MRLASVDAIPYALPFKQPYVTARGTLTEREMVLLRLRDEDGVVGLGEAVPLSLRGGATLAQVVGELEGFAESQEAHGLSAPARCAIETAQMDLRGRRQRTEQPSEPVRCNATLVAGPPAEVASAARRWADAGFTTFKLKLGAGWDDVAQVRAVRDELGSAARIRVDVNAAWDLELAKRMLGELEPLDIELVEQPVASLEEMAALTQASSIPLAADESVNSLAEAEEAKGKRACAYAGVKISKVGGPETALRISAVLPTYVTSALDGPVGIAAAARAAQAIGGDLAHGLATQRLFASTIAAVECELRGEMLYPPPGPGLGVEIDERALDLHRL
ncbi:MAG TPA: enolase C-terminal domain-like protein [Solirubrobacterales bacterium]|nr:enolase C-terminal domain-like protein [Solirubrobacterales bacterium]